jgi:hypothetical protein
MCVSLLTTGCDPHPTRNNGHCTLSMHRLLSTLQHQKRWQPRSRSHLPAKKNTSQTSTRYKIKSFEILITSAFIQNSQRGLTIWFSHFNSFLHSILLVKKFAKRITNRKHDCQIIQGRQPGERLCSAGCITHFLLVREGSARKRECDTAARVMFHGQGWGQGQPSASSRPSSTQATFIKAARISF